MISASNLVLDGLGGPGGPHHMGFVEPYLRSKLPNSEFLRPLPKPAPLVPRYNARPSPSQSPRKDYLPPAVTSVAGPVNLAKNDDQLETSRGAALPPHLAPSYTSRMFPPAGFYPNPYPIYASPYTALLTRPTYINATPLSPLESQYSQQQVSPSNPAFRSRASAYSPPQHHQPTPPLPHPVSQPPPPTQPEKRPFKVPPGRELKHKVAIRSKRPGANHNNNTLPPNFTKGSFIQLSNGVLRRVEDMSTEDFISSAESLPGFRLDPSTVVRLEEGGTGPGLVLTLSHGRQKRTVDLETTPEHPYFIYGRGWASYSPEKTLSCYGLNCQRLQVGDICVTLSPRQTSVPEAPSQPPPAPAVDSDPEDTAGRRRRWSAPDPIDADEEIIDPGSPGPAHKRVKE